MYRRKDQKMNDITRLDKIKKAAFVYLAQNSVEYYVADDLSYNIQRRPQLGLQYLCAALEKRRIKTDIFDQTVSLFDLDWLVERLKEYDMVGFYCSDPQEDYVKAHCRRIKEELGMPVLVGGPSTFENPSFLDHGCDIVVYGEGEITIQQIVEYYNGERNLESIKGIFYKRDGGVVKTLPQELVKDLDSLPFPDRLKVDINSYYDYFLFGMKRPYITMVAARGCIYRCSFCTSCNLWRNRYRRRSVGNVISEIDDVVEKYGVKYIAFQDDVFGVTNDWLEQFCKRLIEKHYRMRWMAILHPFSLRIDTQRMLELMKRAGCDTLSFGLQSAHPEILKNIRRDPSEPQALNRILKLGNSMGFVTSASYIFGLPGDTKETIQTTIDYSLSCGSTLVNYFMLSVLRGSEMERTYNSRRICELPKKTIQDLAVYASRKFYTRPTNILKIAYYIIKNPEWLIKKGISFPSVLARVGFFKAKNE